jgi:hypothetical protein
MDCLPHRGPDGILLKRATLELHDGTFHRGFITPGFKVDFEMEAETARQLGRRSNEKSGILPPSR